MRIIGANLQDPEAFDRLQKMRPRPSNYITWGTTKQLQEIYEKAKSKKGQFENVQRKKWSNKLKNIVILESVRDLWKLRNAELLRASVK